MSLASTGFELVTKRTRKCEFLDEMTLVILRGPSCWPRLRCMRLQARRDARSEGKGPKTSPIRPKMREIVGKFSAGFAM
jgi:hypothetical protein